MGPTWVLSAPDGPHKPCYLGCILMEISLKFVPMGPIKTNSELVHIIAWQQTGNKPLNKAMMVYFTDEDN